MIVTFCGHANAYLTPDETSNLKEVITSIILKNSTTEFLCGHYGKFDILCFNILKKLQIEYPSIKINFVTPYISPNYSKLTELKNIYDEIIYPNLENIPYKFAIIERNKWMIKKSDVVIAYVKRSFGGARKTLDFAQKQNKKIIEI